MQHDIKAFFGTYRAACSQADQAVLELGSAEARDRALREASVGKLLPNALYIHVDALSVQPLLIRLYEGCARSYAGSIDSANIVKLSRTEAKVSYLNYPNFASKAHPRLASSLSVGLQTFQFHERDYRTSANPPVLHRKESFLPVDHPDYDRYLKLTASEERHGLLVDAATIGTSQGWSRRLSERGFTVRGHRLIRAK